MRQLAAPSLFFLSLLSASSVAGPLNPALDGIINVGSRPAPERLELDSYNRWVEPIARPGGSDFSSAFAPKIFSWFEREKDSPLPREVAADPEKIHVNVAGPKAETLELEEKGEITPFTAAGAEVYAEFPGTVDQALEAQLNVWGKPVGKSEGKTKPAPMPFNKRANYLAPNPLWGGGAFASLEIRKNGGIIKDLSDRYLLLVRGDSSRGYDVLMQFIGPVGESRTSNVLALATIRPSAGGRVAFKISSRYQGQSYLTEILRNQIGFNATRVREIQKAYVDSVQELRTTGKIKDRDNDL